MAPVHRMNTTAFQEQYAVARGHVVVEAQHGLVREVAALAQQIRWEPARLTEYNYPLGMAMATTCCCHIVVDDENIRDSDVAFCIQYAAEREHSDCLRLALLLARCSLTQRRKVHWRAWS